MLLVLVYVQRGSITGEESRFATKQYHSVRTPNESGLTHPSMELQALSPEYQPILLESGDADDLGLLVSLCEF